MGKFTTVCIPIICSGQVFPKSRKFKVIISLVCRRSHHSLQPFHVVSPALGDVNEIQVMLARVGEGG